jgi:hypothetical protein
MFDFHGVVKKQLPLILDLIMKTTFLLFLFYLLLNDAYGQTKNISDLNDEFDDSKSLVNWKKVHEQEGWPDQTAKLEIKDGNLIFEPGKSGWFNDDYAPLYYKEVAGDFDVRMRVKATALDGGVPQTKWSLGGLMVRQAKTHPAVKGQPRAENWLFLNFGAAEIPGKQVIESKYTLNSKSNLKLRDAQAEWITLRAVRVGHAYITLYKYDNDKSWTVQDRYYIQQWPPVLQVGVNGYTGSAGGKNDFAFNRGFYPLLRSKDYI